MAWFRAGSTKAMVDFLVDVAQYGNVRLSDAAEERILDDLREAAAGLFEAPLRSVAVVGGASEALGQLAILTGEGRRRGAARGVRFSQRHLSVARCARAVRHRSSGGCEDSPRQDLTAALVDGIQSGTTAVCFSAVQFATGSLVDVGEVVRRAHAVGARVIVDVTQMAGAMAVSLRSWSADALVCSGYKWLSTHGGVALLVVADELLQGVPPIVGWKGTQHPFQFDPTTLALATDARRFELSTIAYSSAAGLSTSIELLSGVGFAALTGHAEALARELVAATDASRLDAIPRSRRARGEPSHRLAASSHARRAVVQARLAEEHQIVVSSRGGGIRVSFTPTTTAPTSTHSLTRLATPADSRSVHASGTDCWSDNLGRERHISHAGFV